MWRGFVFLQWKEKPVRAYLRNYSHSCLLEAVLVVCISNAYSSDLGNLNIMAKKCFQRQKGKFNAVQTFPADPGCLVDEDSPIWLSSRTLSMAAIGNNSCCFWLGLFSFFVNWVNFSLHKVEIICYRAAGDADFTAPYSASSIVPKVELTCASSGCC